MHGLPDTTLTFQAADWISRNNNKTIQHVLQHDRIVTGDFPMPISVTVGGTDPTYLALGPVPDVQVRPIDLFFSSTAKSLLLSFLMPVSGGHLHRYPA